MKPEPIEFQAELIKNPDLDGAYIEIPFSIEEVFGAKRVKVKVSFDGVSYRGSIVMMGGKAIIGVTKAIRAQIGKQPGDTITVRLEKDTEARTIELPADVTEAFEKAGVLGRWQETSYSYQREHMQWINEAKKQETRDRRINKLVEAVKARPEKGKKKESE